MKNVQIYGNRIFIDGSRVSIYGLGDFTFEIEYNGNRASIDMSEMFVDGFDPKFGENNLHSIYPSMEFIRDKLVERISNSNIGIGKVHAEKLVPLGLFVDCIVWQLHGNTRMLRRMENAMTKAGINIREYR